ncbi:MAG: hypothetical protein DDT40_01941 [candidate division WS2 bacterium]|nr:hypothetical protein [Candidatus Psychracetigena formicireducens]
MDISPDVPAIYKEKTSFILKISYPVGLASLRSIKCRLNPLANINLFKASVRASLTLSPSVSVSTFVFSSALRACSTYSLIAEGDTSPKIALTPVAAS